MDYQVTIKEQLIRKLLVNSASLKEAEAAVASRYKSREIVLDHSDFVDVTFLAKRATHNNGTHLVPYYRSTNRDFTLLHGDCMELLEKFSFKFDMIFADPPYALPQLEQLPDIILSRQLLREDGLFVLEHGKTQDFSNHPRFVDHRAYGSVNFSFFK